MRYYLDSKLRLVHQEVKKLEEKTPTDNNVHYVAGILAAIRILALDQKMVAAVIHFRASSHSSIKNLAKRCKRIQGNDYSHNYNGTAQ